MRNPIKLSFRLLFPLVAMLAIASCQSGELDIQGPEAEGQQKELREVIITASISDAQDETRTSYNETEGKNYWSPGDKIKVFSAGEEAEFTSMNTSPEPIVKFKGYIASITGSSNDDDDSKDYVWGLYPYSTGATYAEPDGISRTARITTTYPDVQVGVAGTFGDNLAVMIGRSESLSIPFRGAYSGAFFKVSRSDIVSMTLRGLNNEVLVGKATIGLDNTLLPVVEEVTDGKTAVTVTAPNGTFEPDKNYYIITLPDVALPNGYSVTLRRSDGYEGTYELRANRPLNRIRFRNLSEPVDVRIENPANISDGVSTGWVQSTTQGINEIWYTSTDGEAVEYTIASGSDNEIDSNISPDDNGGVGIVRFKSPLTEIDERAFQAKENLSSITLPETVEYIGFNAFLGCSNLVTINLGSNVKRIEEGAFWNCAFEAITLPEGLEWIGADAFAGCANLTEITIPDSVESIGHDRYGTFIGNPFLDCYSLTQFNGKYASDDHLCLIRDDELLVFASGALEGETYTIPEGVVRIQKWAFAETLIGHVVFPSSLRYIHDYAFEGSSLVDVTIPANVTHVYPYAFYNCRDMNWAKIAKSDATLKTVAPGKVFESSRPYPIYVPAGKLHHYKNSQFWDRYEDRYVPIIAPNAMLVTLTEGANINDIAWENVFTDPQIQDLGDDVYTVTGSDDITTIPRNAFQNVTTIKEVTIPESVETIATYAFAGCSNLEGVTFGSNVTQIMAEAFAVCKLETVTLPESLTFLGAGAFQNNPLTTVEIPASLSTISQNPFLDCNNLASFTGDNSMVSSDGHALINADGELLSYALAATTGEYQVPEGVVTIGKTAMKGAKFTKVILPSTLEKIGLGAFRYSDLTEITIPESVTEIIDFAFLGCSSLTKMRIEGEVVPTLGQGVFTYTPDDLEIWVPGLTVDDYVNENYAQPNWYAMRNHIACYQSPKEIWYHNYDDSESYYDMDFGALSDAHFRGWSVLHIDASHSKIDPIIDVPESIGEATIMIAMFNVAPESIPDGLFAGRADYIDYVSLPTTVTTIGASAFSGCSLLAAFPSHRVTSIGAEAFLGCASLTSVSCAATSIGANAFKNCTSLVSVTTGEIITSIGDGTFYGCTALQSVNNGNLNTGVNFSTVRSVGDEAFRNCSSLTSVSLPRATSLGSHAFYGCDNISSLSIPKVSILGTRCFYNHKLTTISLPAITSIGIGALGRGSLLRIVGIGPNITDMRNRLFSYPTGTGTTAHQLARIVMAGENPPRIDTTANTGTFAGITFRDSNGCFVVPSETAVANYVEAWGLPEQFFSVSNN